MIQTLFVLCLIASAFCAPPTIDPNNPDQYSYTPVLEYLHDAVSVDALILAQGLVYSSGVTAYLSTNVSTNASAAVCDYTAALLNQQANLLTLTANYFSAKATALAGALGQLDVFAAVGVDITLQVEAAINAFVSVDPLTLGFASSDRIYARSKILNSSWLSANTTINLVLQQDLAIAVGLVDQIYAAGAAGKYIGLFAKLGSLACADITGSSTFFADVMASSSAKLSVLGTLARKTVVTGLQALLPTFPARFTTNATLRAQAGLTMAQVQSDIDISGRQLFAAKAALVIHTHDEIRAVLGFTAEDENRLAVIRRLRDLFFDTAFDASTEVSALAGVTVTDFNETVTVAAHLDVTITVTYGVNATANTIASVNARLVLLIQGWAQALVNPSDVEISTATQPSNGVTVSVYAAKTVATYINEDISTTATATYTAAVNAAIATVAFVNYPNYVSVVTTTGANLAASLTAAGSLITTTSETVTTQASASASASTSASSSAAAVDYTVISDADANYNTETFALATLQTRVTKAANLQIQTQTAHVTQIQYNLAALNLSSGYLDRNEAYLRQQIFLLLQQTSSVNITSCSIQINFTAEYTLDDVNAISATASCSAAGALLGKLVLLKRALGTILIAKTAHANLKATVSANVAASASAFASSNAALGAYASSATVFAIKKTEQDVTAVWTTTDFQNKVQICLQAITVDAYASVSVSVAAQASGMFTHTATGTFDATLDVATKATAQVSIAARLPICISTVTGGNPDYISSKSTIVPSKKRYISNSLQGTTVEASQNAGYGGSGSSMITFSFVALVAALAFFFM